jgi:hypothetical protein
MTSNDKMIIAIYLMALQVLIRKCADTDMLVCNQFQPQVGDVQEVQLEVMEEDNTVQHIVEVPLVVILIAIN